MRWKDKQGNIMISGKFNNVWMDVTYNNSLFLLLPVCIYFMKCSVKYELNIWLLDHPVSDVQPSEPGAVFASKS